MIPVLAYGPSRFLRHAFLSGCSDYIKSPFDAQELYFRIVRNIKYKNNPLIWNGLRIGRDRITWKHDEIPISYQQYLILKLLIRNINTPVPREVFQYIIRGKIKEESRDIDMNISIIRTLLKDLKVPCHIIKTVRGIGYMIDDSACG